MKKSIYFIGLLTIISINSFSQCADIEVYNSTNCQIDIKVNYYYNNNSCTEIFTCPAQQSFTVPGLGDGNPCSSSYCISNFSVSAAGCGTLVSYIGSDTGGSWGPFYCSCAHCDPYNNHFHVYYVADPNNLPYTLEIKCD